MNSIYDFTVLDAKKQPVRLDKYKGQVLLIVNTATGCGFTPQYEGLESLYRKYSEQGFVVLDFPCNQFAGQAPGTEEEIVSFCQLKYDVSFPQFAKIKVNGSEADPLYKFLKEQKTGILGSAIKWNFTKFLVDREGNVLKRYAPTTKPADIEKDIVSLL
ncbi:MAG: glutathione peroxidase [Bacteroidaceae bacterium]|nr:glutathione peroxidase [Bacteroidaceae bacterium]